jgi:hypothetical protein
LPRPRVARCHAPRVIPVTQPAEPQTRGPSSPSPLYGKAVPGHFNGPPATYYIR